MEGKLSLQYTKVVEEAAIAAARTMGRGDWHLSYQAAVDAMRRVFSTVPIAGRIVIGEGERDEAPRLYIGERVGTQNATDGDGPEIDIVVDPLEGTNLCAQGFPGAITVMAAASRGGLFHAPDCYMEKIVVGPSARGVVDLDAPVRGNLQAIARQIGCSTEDLVVVVLDRPRHRKLIADIRSAGARIRLIPEGDLSASIATAISGTGVHVVMGIGGAPEGVLAAAALRCLNGQILGRLIPKDLEQEGRLKSMGIKDAKKVYTTNELAPGEEIIFVATGVTDGDLLKGVRFLHEGVRVQSMVMTHCEPCIRFIDSIHLPKRLAAPVNLF